MAKKDTRLTSFRTPRFIRGYPRKRKPLIHLLRRSAIKFIMRQPRPRIHARPWQYKTAISRELALEEAAVQGVRGSLQERIFYKALVQHGFIPEVDFTFQPSMMGGRAELGGLVADFLFPLVGVIVQVQSYWHTISLEVERRDTDQQMVLQGMGYIVFDIWPNTIEDPAALDLWMERNLMHLWGTSSQPLGISHGRDMPLWMVILYNYVYVWLSMLTEISDNLGGPPAPASEPVPLHTGGPESGGTHI